MHKIEIKFPNKCEFETLIDKLNTLYVINKIPSKNNCMEVFYESDLIYTSKENFVSTGLISSKKLVKKIDNFINNKIKYRNLNDIAGSDSILLDEY